MATTWLRDFYLEARTLVQGNEAWAWVLVLVVSIAAASIIKLTLRFLAGRLRRLTTRTSSSWDDVSVDLIDGIKPSVLFAWFFFLLSRPLEPAPWASKVMLVIVVLLTIFQLALWGLHVIKSWRDSTLKHRMESDPSSAAALGLFYTLVQGLFLVVLVLVGLSNVGIDVGALVAGLGVGGIAVALAAQNILGDLLASLSIVLDKPFVVGDFIAAGSEMGTVENIGIKTTRLRSLSGEQLILSNKDLLESRIRNHKRMWQRRVVVRFGVVYSTAPETLEKIPTWVRGFVERHDKLVFDRCHLAELAASSLDYELVFLVADADYNRYMDLQQIVFLDIIKKLRDEKVDFAFPTRTIQVETLPKIETKAPARERLALGNA